MKKLFTVGLVSLFLGGCTLPFLGNKQAAVQVNSTPNASVYLNGNHVGQSPFFSDKIKPGEYTVRILVENDPTKDWQAKVTLNPQIVTVINRVFGTGAVDSSHYILHLEPLPTNTDQEISIISIPDNVIVKIDGQPQGFSPVSVKNLTEGDHTIVLTAPGYEEMVIQTQTKKGYKLVISASLAKLAQTETNPTATASASLQPATATPSATPKVTPTMTPKVSPKPAVSASPSASSSATTLARPYVTVLTTPTGWLRVRATGDANGEEIAKINPGESYKYLESNDTGWYKIVLNSGESGWVSAKYVQLYK